MSTRIFTLSAVCVMVFCMLLAVSGTTDLSKPEKGFHGRLDSGTSGLVPDRTADARILPVSPSSIDPSVSLSADIERAQKEQKGPQPKDFNRQVRTFGLLFILAWVFISVKLLSTK